jgi:hypothetical protein
MSVTCLILLFSQDRLQRGYIELSQSLPWFHLKLAELDIDDSEDMLKEVCALNHFTLHTHHIIA